MHRHGGSPADLQPAWNWQASQRCHGCERERGRLPRKNTAIGTSPSVTGPVVPAGLADHQARPGLPLLSGSDSDSARLPVAWGASSSRRPWQVGPANTVRQHCKTRRSNDSESPAGFGSCGLPFRARPTPRIARLAWAGQGAFHRARACHGGFLLARLARPCPPFPNLNRNALLPARTVKSDESCKRKKKKNGGVRLELGNGFRTT